MSPTNPTFYGTVKIQGPNIGAWPTMKQKYQIVKNTKDRQLVIQEYAVLTSTLRRKDFPGVQDDEYSLLCEQTYDAKSVKTSISKGKPALISLLRSRHLFPIGLYMDKIADTVITMFAAKGDQSEFLTFDDKEFIYGEPLDEEIQEDMDEEEDAEGTDDLDGLLKDDIKIKDSVSPDSTDHEPFDEEKS
jgi:hypothetical protein